MRRLVNEQIGKCSFDWAPLSLVRAQPLAGQWRMPYPPRTRLVERYLDPHYKAHYRSCPLGTWEIAIRAGFPNQTHFSSLINADVIRVSPLIEERLRRVADIIGYPRDRIFLPEPARQAVTHG
jgi:hypothetical protein